MAVPKRKTSKSRRDKRRATHAISAPQRERLPPVRAAEAAASRLPDLRHVQGPRGRAAPHRRSVAHDDPHRGRRDGRRPRPRRDRRGRARGADRRRSSRSSSATPAIDTRGLELQRDHGVIEMDEKPAEAVRAKPESSLVACRPRRRRGRGGRGRLGRQHRRDARRRPARAAPHPRRACGRRSPSRSRRSAARRSCSTRARTPTRGPEHLLQFATMGAVFAEEILGVPNPEVRLLSIGEEPEKGNQLTLEAHELLARERPQLQGQHRGPRHPRAAPPTSSSPTASPATSR